MKILVSHHREEDQGVEHHHNGGQGAVATHPGPGYTPPGGGVAWGHSLSEISFMIRTFKTRQYHNVKYNVTD